MFTHHIYFLGVSMFLWSLLHQVHHSIVRSWMTTHTRSSVFKPAACVELQSAAVTEPVWMPQIHWNHSISSDEAVNIHARDKPHSTFHSNRLFSCYFSSLFLKIHVQISTPPPCGCFDRDARREVLLEDALLCCIPYTQELWKNASVWRVETFCHLEGKTFLSWWNTSAYRVGAVAIKVTELFNGRRVWFKTRFQVCVSTQKYTNKQKVQFGIWDVCLSSSASTDIFTAANRFSNQHVHVNWSLMKVRKNKPVVLRGFQVKTSPCQTPNSFSNCKKEKPDSIKVTSVWKNPLWTVLCCETAEEGVSPWKRTDLLPFSINLHCYFSLGKAVRLAMTSRRQRTYLSLYHHRLT